MVSSGCQVGGGLAGQAEGSLGRQVEALEEDLAVARREEQREWGRRAKEGTLGRSRTCSGRRGKRGGYWGGVKPGLFRWMFGVVEIGFSKSTVA